MPFTNNTMSGLIAAPLDRDFGGHVERVGAPVRPIDVSQLAFTDLAVDGLRQCDA